MRTRCLPDPQHEERLRARGYRTIAGLDEAGRGAWAGPVVAAVCILPDSPSLLRPLEGVCDSKLLTARQRTYFEGRIRAAAQDLALGEASACEIDAFGIVPATRLAMQRALARLRLQPDLLVIDALHLEVPTPQLVTYHADLNYLCVACASIVAKTARDRLMCALDDSVPGYYFARHKGYGTALHRRMLAQNGICAEHRRSYRPVAQCQAPANA
ncbi:MAG: ribonuclease HII [Chloroflexi bacterium]|nr:ribonuclease HII [Chloroflexota bacterium]